SDAGEKAGQKRISHKFKLESFKHSSSPQKYGGFSVPAFASRALARQAVFPATASLQTGFPLRSNRLQLFCFFPDTWSLNNTRHLTPKTLIFGA
ncbi:MAG: hypothetical protein V3R70_01965, partial [Syntrophobacteria bacterium]